MPNLKWICVFLLLLTANSQAFSQVIISGSIADSLQQPLSDINILIFQKHSGTLKAFSISGPDGKYAVEVNLDADSLDIVASSIHFGRVKYTISNQTQQIDFLLKPDTKLLETFTVRANPIEKVGDTLSYLIAKFIGKEDRSIEDVLKKLPGIEVEESGKILYQGMPINKFYVEGLDLTDGRYNMISSNLPHESVSTVEVFEKHQPIRILEDRVYSPQAALNIKLKKKAAYTGSGSVASGFSPGLWDLKLTPMLLSTDFQLLASYQTNNTGNDVSRQLQQLIPRDRQVFPFQPSESIMLFDLASSEQYGAIDKKRYLDNRVHLANFNMLLPLKKDLQLHANIYFMDDIRENKSFEERIYYLPDDTIRLNQDYSRKQKMRYWQGTFDLNRNTKNNYLKNKTHFTFQDDAHEERIINASDTINQLISAPYQRFSNTLNSIFKSGETLIEFQSLLQYDKGPQELTVAPGQFEAIVNSGEAYDEAFQSTTLERFYADHYVGSNFRWKRWVISLRLGFALRMQTLFSELQISDDNTLFEAGESFKNNMEAWQYQLYLIPALQYKYKGFRFSLDWPFNQQRLELKEIEINQSQTSAKLLQAPKLSFHYTFGGFWDLSTSWYYYQRISDPDNFYYAYLLKNYRELIKTEALIQQTNQHIASATLSYRNTITAFFNTLTYMYVQREMNLTYSMQLQENGAFVVTAQQIPNISHTHNVRFRSSKYVNALKSSLSLNASFMLNQGKTLVNDALFDTETKQYSLTPEVYFQATTWLNLNYKLHHNVMNSSIDGELRNQIRMNKHYFTLNLFPADNQMLTLNLEYFQYNKTAYDFVDLMYRYRFKKSRFDLEARWNNILNSAVFIENYSYQFTVLTNTQSLRPSQFLLSLKFSF